MDVQIMMRNGETKYCYCRDCLMHMAVFSAIDLHVACVFRVDHFVLFFIFIFFASLTVWAIVA